MRIPIKTAEDIKKMRAACAVTVQVLDEVGDLIKPGISTEEINRFVHDRILKQGATPSPLYYKGYPKSVCTSINDVVCHGIPSAQEILNSGDIINVDVTSYKSGFHGDSSRMYFVGGRQACSEAAVTLCDTTKAALFVGIEQVKPGNRIGDIGAAIQEFIESTGRGYGIVREYTGHGVGKQFHEAPTVLHYGRWGMGDEMKPGMIFTIEPMINAGNYLTKLSKEDGWTVRTKDGSLSAQWEHSILVTPSGHEILTDSEKF